MLLANQARKNLVAWEAERLAIREGVSDPSSYRRLNLELVAPKVDGTTDAVFAFPNAPDVRLLVAMRSLRRPLEVQVRFVGTRGRIDL